MTTSSLLSEIPVVAAAILGVASAGLAGSLYLVLIAVAALSAIFSKKKTTRDAALTVLRTLLPGRDREKPGEAALSWEFSVGGQSRPPRTGER